MAEILDKLKGRILIEDASEDEMELVGYMMHSTSPMTMGKPAFVSEARWTQIRNAVMEAKANPISVMDLPVKRESVLEEAQCIVNGDRDADYGDSNANMLRIAGIVELLIDDSEWEALSKQVVSATVIAKVLIAVKLARERNKHKRDNLVDLAGYTELLNRLYE